MQVAVQGAWGIVPVHLNELSPGAVRAMFPGFAYQLGNLLMSRNVVFQAGIAESRGDDYALALALFGGITAVIIAVVDRVRSGTQTRRLPRRGEGRSRLNLRADARCSFETTSCRATAEPPTGRTGQGHRRRDCSSRGARCNHPDGPQRPPDQPDRRTADHHRYRGTTPPPVRPPKPAPKPQQAKKPAGAPAPKAQAAPIVAPQPKLPLPSPIPAAKVAGAGSASSSGAGTSGTGTGAGGSGNGPAAADMPTSRASPRARLVRNLSRGDYRLIAGGRMPAGAAMRLAARSTQRTAKQLPHRAVERRSVRRLEDCARSSLNGCDSGLRSTTRGALVPYQLPVRRDLEALAARAGDGPGGALQCGEALHVASIDVVEIGDRRPVASGIAVR